mgnify:CR=1 FL=1
MKTIDEKEKKLKEVLIELKNLEISKPNQLEELEILKNQKNQLEIEKEELEKKYNSLEEINENLKKKLTNLEDRERKDKIKEEQFSEKIDELNQETDSLMNEIEKWQM